MPTCPDDNPIVERVLVVPLAPSQAQYVAAAIPDNHDRQRLHTGSAGNRRRYGLAVLTDAQVGACMTGCRSWLSRDTPAMGGGNRPDRPLRPPWSLCVRRQDPRLPDASRLRTPARWSAHDNTWSEGSSAPSAPMGAMAAAGRPRLVTNVALPVSATSRISNSHFGLQPPSTRQVCRSIWPRIGSETRGAMPDGEARRQNENCCSRITRLA